MDATTPAAITGMIDGLTTAAAQMQTSIGEIVPIALGVATTILVITVGWRLFRNFTRG